MAYPDVLTIPKPRVRNKVKVQIRREKNEDDLYPDSDGKPMGETGFHVRAIMSVYEALCHLFRNTPDVYVAADMFLYYKKGYPKVNKSPDVMVVKGVPKHERRSFKTWQEGAVPCVIIEVTSKSTIVEDMMTKTMLYASLGVKEYFLFDPLREYLDPPLIGGRLSGSEYLPIEPNVEGNLLSEELGTALKVDEEFLRVLDPLTGEVIPTLDEALLQVEEAQQRAEEADQRAEQEAQRAEQEAQRAEQEAQRAAQETQRAEQEHRRAEAAEAELARLKALLENK